MARPIAREFKASNGSVELLLTEEITQNTAERLIAQLSSYKGQSIDLSIYSQGGNAEAAFAIYDYITAKDNDMHITANVYGMAASGAMIIAAGCEKRFIGDSSFAMAHYAYALEAENMSEADKARLGAMNERQIALFQQVTGKGRVDIKHLLDEGRDMHAADAVAFGLFNGTIEQAKVAALLTPKTMTETKSTVRRFKVGHKALLAAALTSDGEVEVPETLIEAADAEKVKALDAQILALTTERDALKVKADTIPVVEKEKTDAITAKTEADGKILALTTERDTFQAKVEALEKNPLVAAVLSGGNEVVVPGAAATPTLSKTKKDIELETGANAYAAAKKEYWGEPAKA